ncbi:MAG TPA: hypothetical protein VK213_06010 [Bacteroidales bacterium]|nr:hypothetical protein [Bacteroidales bacterium]
MIPFSGFKINSDDNGLPVTGYIDITVESNVNKVLFTYPISESNIAPGRNDRKTSIVLPVKDFRCDNKIAYKDFINLLKADTYPELTIDLPGKVLQQIRERENVTLRNVTINIAGVSKKYDIVCTEEKAADGEKVLAGTIVVGLTDLHIDPPKKYFGMVKIKDEVIVKFGLGLKDQSYAQK